MSKSAAPEVELAKLALEDTSATNGAANGAAAAGTNSPAAAASPRDSTGGGDFKESFKAFSKFGDTKSDGKQITLSQSDKWMKQAKVIDKKITTTDTAIHFKKLKSMKLSYGDYNKFLEDLANAKKMEVADIKNKLSSCGAPGVPQLNAGKAAAAVNRLTDTSKYTGSSKQRFDETGKGKGIAGRKNVVDASGYVSGYQHKDTYDNVH